MADDRFNWIKIANSEAEISFQENNIAEIMLGERRVCIAKFRQELFVFSNKCPHASGLFVNGYIDAVGDVVCPIHRYKFCMHNGRNVTGEGYFLKHWVVEVKEDGIYVRSEKNELFDLL
jgi:3-phenylpropionate/trans-cinnamate dioxygenase ferredoxin subunit